MVTRFFQTKAIPPSLWNPCLCAAVPFYNNTYRWRSKHSSWLSVAIRIERHGEDPSQDPGRCTNNAHWGHNIILRCCRWRAILYRTNRWGKRDWRTNPWEETAIWKKRNRMGSTRGTILNEAKYKRNYKYWRKHNDVLHTRNQSKCTDTSSTRFRSCHKKTKNSKYLASHMMKCYWQQTNDLSITRRMKIVSSSKMDCSSGNTTERLVISNTTKSWYQGN